ncbi:sodium:proton antiporter [Brevibacillus sp. SYP-B805]|uniref:Na+/H+ antiporter NhaC family protein n=1 Tax=Brevibacillus sp. SYP-B805 TaxID=1578199 RepID=UPI0013EE3895|nr:Na+/H+ antiporter NhaC family protein [Brevibacillus sp. SYP-B805]NGQ95093.1 sodium:proton antiporter [Brevibacillus sp. SYP-B805]
MTFRMYVPVIALIAGIAASLSLSFPLALGILFALLVTLAAVKGLGYSYREQLQFGWEGVRQAKPVLSILFLVGLLIPLLMMGGTIPAIIYYGLSIVNVDYLFVLSFALTALVSCLLGTSVGTLSTVGLSLMGIAHAAQMPLGMMAGALISGAMVGERFSPLSSSRLLVISSVKADARIERYSITTGGIAVGLSAIFFLALDLWMKHAPADSMIASYQELLRRYFSPSLVPLLPLVILIGSFALRVKATRALGYGIASAALLVTFTHPAGWTAFVKAMLFGYELGSGTKLDALVHGGGMLAILQVLLLISLAGFMNGILNKAQLMEPLVDRLIGKTDSVPVLVTKSVMLSLVVVIISCNQTIPILILGTTLQNRFARFPDGSLLFGRTMLDSTLVMPVLIPWNGLAMVMSVTLGVPTIQTLPYLCFGLVLPLVTILFSRYHRAGKTDGFASSSRSTA